MFVRRQSVKRLRRGIPRDPSAQAREAVAAPLSSHALGEAQDDVSRVIHISVTQVVIEAGQPTVRQVKIVEEALRVLRPVESAGVLSCADAATAPRNIENSASQAMDDHTGEREPEKPDMEVARDASSRSISRVAQAGTVILGIARDVVTEMIASLADRWLPHS